MSSSMVFCRGCGKEIHETAPTCPGCGAPQLLPKPMVAAEVPPSLKNQTVAGLMCFFLGTFGGLHFYLGRPIIGGLFLLFCWTGIPTLISYVELALLAFKTPKEWADAVNHGVVIEPVHTMIKVLVFVNILLFFISLVFWSEMLR